MSFRRSPKFLALALLLVGAQTLSAQATVADVMADPGVEREFVAASGGLRPYWPGTGDPTQSWRLVQLGPSRWGAAWGSGESPAIVPSVARETRRVSV